MTLTLKNGKINLTYGQTNLYLGKNNASNKEGTLDTEFNLQSDVKAAVPKLSIVTFTSYVADSTENQLYHNSLGLELGWQVVELNRNWMTSLEWVAMQRVLEIAILEPQMERKWQCMDYFILF